MSSKYIEFACCERDRNHVNRTEMPKYTYGDTGAREALAMVNLGCCGCTAKELNGAGTRCRHFITRFALVKEGGAAR